MFLRLRYVSWRVHQLYSCLTRLRTHYMLRAALQRQYICSSPVCHYNSSLIQEVPKRRRHYTCLLAFAGLLGIFKSEEDTSSEEVPPSVKKQLLKAHRALRQGDYSGAERAYHKALELLATSQHAASQAYIEARAVTLDKLANMYLEQERLDEAEANFKETLRVMFVAGVDQEDAAVIEISLKLSKIYTNQRKYEMADSGFLWCIETAQKKWNTIKTEECLALWGMCLHGKGQHHLVVGQDSEAAEAFTKALEIAEEVYGNTHIQVAVLHNDLATALDRTGQYTVAEEHVLHSLEIASSVVDQDVLEHLATFHYNLGMILVHQGKRSPAVEAYKKAIQQAKKLKDRTLYDRIRKEL